MGSKGLHAQTNRLKPQDMICKLVLRDLARLPESMNKSLGHGPKSRVCSFSPAKPWQPTWLVGTIPSQFDEVFGHQRVPKSVAAWSGEKDQGSSGSLSGYVLLGYQLQYATWAQKSNLHDTLVIGFL